MAKLNKALLESIDFCSNLKTDIQSLAKNGQFFGADFTKADGTTRRMNCRLAVKKYLKGGGNKTADKLSRLVVYDVNARGYRTIPIERLKALRIAGQAITFE